MTAKIIDGKAIAGELRAELAQELEELKKAGAQPGIATLMVGDDFGAGMYRGAVEKFCGEMGLGYRDETLPAEMAERISVPFSGSMRRLVICFLGCGFSQAQIQPFQGKRSGFHARV